jgi:hypothetical protein
LQRLARLPARTLLLIASLLLGLGFFAWWTNRQDPILGWLALAHLRHWTYGLLFLAACFASGWRATRPLLPGPPPLAERASYAVAAGTLIFAVGVFVGGLLGLYGRVFFFAWPLLMLAWGGVGIWPQLVRCARRLRPFGARLYTPRSALEAVVAAGGFLGLVAIYLLVMNPDNVGWDARWYHLSIAEHYAAAGKIRAFGEGWYLGTYPQLASWLYTWAFQAPGSLVEHVLVAAHIEWFLFLATLPALSSLVRRLLGGVRVPFAGAALFLFPGIFLYDSSLIVGADHVLAFFAPALALALIRLSKRFDEPTAVLVALFTAGAVLTKYQAIYFVVPTTICLGYRTARTRNLRPLLVWAGATLAATAPHWLKNVVFYGNPTYPLLHQIFPSHPFHKGAGAIMEQIYMTPGFALKGTALEKLARTAAALLDFSFVPNDWVMFHGQRPVFGSLFTLLLPALLFLKARPRLYALIAASHLGVLLWYVTSHQDRFLQALLPWMAACTAALVVAIWQQVPRARAALLALLGFQVVWGGDVYFLRSHAMVGDSPLKSLVDRISLTHQRRSDERLKWGGRLASIGRELPRTAKVLVHDMNVKLGLGVPTIEDEIGWQGTFEYVDLDVPARAAELWRKLGATHALWLPDRGDQTWRQLAREAVFQRTLKLYQAGEAQHGEFRLTTLRPTTLHPEAAAAPTRLAWLGCGGDPAAGLYTPQGLGDGRPERRFAPEALAGDPRGTLAEVNAIVLRDSCGGQGPLQSEIYARFERVVSAGGVALWIRRAEGPP